MPNYFDIPAPFHLAEKARVVIIPAPYEGTVSWGRGTANGPQALLDVSSYIETYDSVLDAEPYRQGIYVRPALKLPPEPEAAIAAVEEAVAEVLAAGKKPAMIGGEHSISLGAVRACRKAHPDLSVLQLDAHADLRDEYEGSRFSHACVMRRVADLGVPFSQAGIRAMSAEERDWLKGQGRKVVSAHEVVRDPGWIGRALAPLSGKIYFTLDIDVLDPAEMPATGTPEPGGISYHHLLDLILALRDSGREIVGLDLVELAPIPGLTHPQYLAAQLLYSMTALFAEIKK